MQASRAHESKMYSLYNGGYSAFLYKKMYSALYRTLLCILSTRSTLPGGTPRPSADVGSSCPVSGGVRLFMNCFDHLQTPTMVFVNGTSERAISAVHGVL